MKPFAIAFLVAAIAGAMFIYQVNNITHLDEEAAVLSAQIGHHNSLGAKAGSFMRAFFDGLTLGSFAEEGIFTESKKADRESRQLAATRASLLSRYQSASAYRNTGLVTAILAAALGFALKRKAEKDRS